MKRLVLVTIAAAVAGSLTLARPLSAASSAARPAATIRVHGSDYGRVLFDSRGFALYAFTRDSVRRSNCSGECARRWPPYLVNRSARLTAGVGTKRALIGRITRSDGTLQVTYAGRPLYRYVGDLKRGQILCQNASEFGGLWLVVGPTGRSVR